MPLYYSIPIFLVGLALVLGGSVFLSRLMGRLGTCMNIPEQFLGFLTALGSDSPEIASAVVAMVSGQTNVGVGVVFGSNLFNLASLLGLPAILAGGIAVRREAALLGGGVGVLVTAVAVALVLGAAAPVLSLALVLALIAPYAAVLAMRRNTLQKLPLPELLRRFVSVAASETREHGREIEEGGEWDERKREERRRPTGQGQARAQRSGDPGEGQISRAKLLWGIFGILVAIVLGSVALVRSATWLTKGWLPGGLLGTLVLAVLTGIPNLYTAVKLAQSGRGSAVVTEAVNSNSINVLVGLTIPALVFGGVAAHDAGAYLDVGWLMTMTLAVTAMLGISRGLNRKQGWTIVAAYLAFVAVRVYLS